MLWRHRHLPNALTVLRILAIPVVVLALSRDTREGRYVAAAMFAVASLTDYLDGYLARRRGAVSSFGKLADPIADKLLIAGALITLSAQGRAPTWVVVLILARELLITLLRALALRGGDLVVANVGGKLKTALQSAAVVALILAPVGATWALILLYVALTVTLLSGVAYLREFWRLQAKATLSK